MSSSRGKGPEVNRSLRTWRSLRWDLLAVGLFAATVGALMLARPAAAQAPTPSDDQVNAIAKQLYCPVCENVPLDVCPTQACEQWRATIREKLAQGWSEKRIKDYFVEQYGARVLAAPPARGLNWLVYLLPPAAFVGGAVILYRALRSWRRAAAAMPPVAPQPSDDPYVRQLEDEVRRQA